MHYRYSPAVFRDQPAFEADALYVIGGLYGNVEALRTILAMKQQERRRGVDVTLVFNGDFNWFNVDRAGFAEINETVLAYTAIQGNVEAELENGEDCGCNYPPYVDQETVDRSNAIMATLGAVAKAFPRLVRSLLSLPQYLTAQVGPVRIGVLHGDPESLSGWRFAVENMEPPDHRLCAGAGEGAVARRTTCEAVKRYFEQAGVRAFACTHTCLPFAQDFAVGGEQHLVINNGAAGMPNFRDHMTGLITRVSSRPDVPPTSLYGIQLGGARFDAIPVVYDQHAWVARFLGNWPPGSAAHLSYFSRITDGPDFHPAQAQRLGR